MPEPTDQKPDSKPTERVVLERVGEEGAPGNVTWEVIGMGRGSKEKVVAEVAGDRKGLFRAPSLRSWNGIVERKERERPALQTKLLDG